MSPLNFIDNLCSLDITDLFQTSPKYDKQSIQFIQSIQTELDLQMNQLNNDINNDISNQDKLKQLEPIHDLVLNEYTESINDKRKDIELLDLKMSRKGVEKFIDLFHDTLKQSKLVNPCSVDLKRYPDCLNDSIKTWMHFSIWIKTIHDSKFKMEGLHVENGVELIDMLNEINYKCDKINNIKAMN